MGAPSDQPFQPGTLVSAAPLAYELRIGVTGHRELADPPAVTKAVRAVLDHFRQTIESASAEPRGLCGASQSQWRRAVTFLARVLNSCQAGLPVTPSTVRPEGLTPIQWTVVSPLARGADRIVASVVLERPDAKLEALLPLPQDDYECDFQPGDDLDEFRALLARATVTRVYGGTAGAGPDTTRNDAYLAAGQAVVDTCEVVIAIWDGQRARGHGGTAEVVKYAVQQGRVVLWIDPSDPLSAARMLRRPAPLRRRGSLWRRCRRRPPNQKVLPGVVAAPLPQRANDLSARFHQLAAYNRDTAFDIADYRRTYMNNWNRLERQAQRAGLPVAPLHSALQTFLPHYARADQLARRYQSLYRVAAVGLFYLAAAAVTIAVVQVLFFPHIMWPIALEVAAMVLVVVLLGLSLEGAWHERWLQDRHLAEQLRIAFFSTLAGIPSAGDRTGSLLPFYRGPDGWVLDAVARLIDSCPRSAFSADWQAVRRFLRNAWLSTQAKYHRKKARASHEAARQTRLVGLVLFLATLLAATLHMLHIGRVVFPNDAVLSTLLDSLITALAILLPVWGAASHAVDSLLEHDRIAARSRQMSRILREIQLRAHQSNNADRFLAEVGQARDLMVEETHEWLVSLSFRGPVLPA